MTKLTRILGGALALPAGWIAYSATQIDHRMTLPPALEAERHTLTSERAGELCYYADTRAAGRPLLLIHSINAAGSSYEMRPIFEAFRGTRPVYALDLPGFGFSERSERRYSPTLYRDAIVDMLTNGIGEAADVVALSLSSEFAASAALERPDRVASLAIISPTGFGYSQSAPSPQGAQSNGLSDRAYKVLAFPLWAQGLYDLLATRRSIRYFLQMNFVGAVDSGLEDYAYATTHQPGARHAPLHFVSGQLFTSDIRERVYVHLTQPALVIYDHDPNVRFDMLEAMLAAHPNWQAARVSPSLGLPQFEQMPALEAALRAFWGSATA